MSRNCASHCPPFAAVFFLVASLPLAANAAEPDGNDARFREQLAAGEFAPAIADAQSLNRGAARDARMAALAAAQARAGASQSGLLTASQIDDAALRGSTYGELTRSKSFGHGAMGGSQADFDPLIDLITATIAPQTWDTVGGPGSVQPFEGGVHCDAEGALRPLLGVDRTGTLAAMRRKARWLGETPSPAASKNTPLRKVSLTRLEKHLERRLAEGKPPTEEMRALAGLYRVKYVLVYPEQGEIVLAGPAGDWKEDREGRLINRETAQPVVQLDDLIVMLRHFSRDNGGRFGCSITPTQEGLARTKAFVAESNKSPLKPGQRGSWLKALRDQLGPQNIDVYGIDPRTRAARVLVEADYRMKLVGLGLEDSVLGVKSYLDSIVVKPNGPPPPMDVLRWWFTMNYDAVAATPDRNAYEIRGQGVRVLSENEMLTLTGQRVHTGESSPANQAFTNSFTEHFSRLCERYPIYAELRNVFDLALVAALIKTEKLQERVHWNLGAFADPDKYQVALGVAPKSVDTVIAHRVVHAKHIVVGISGGVAADPTTYVKTDAIKTDEDGAISSDRRESQAKDLPLAAWWWD
jgi:hypothetical protein